MKLKHWVVLAIVLLIVGCGLIPVSDGQIDSIGKGVGGAVGSIGGAAVNSFFPGIGYSAEGFIGGIATLATVGLLKLFQKKQKQSRVAEIVSVTKKGK
jgi:hypothetical protein